MHDLIESFQKNGHIQKELCKQTKVPDQTFRHSTTGQNKEPLPEASIPQFIPISVKEGTFSEGVKITYPNGVSIEVANTMHVNFLQTLIHLY